MTKCDVSVLTPAEPAIAWVELIDLHVCQDETPGTAGTADAAETASVEPAQDADRRVARRRPAWEFGPELRIMLPGPAEARPVDVSATGVLTETTHRLCPGRTVDLFLRLNGVRRVLRARVVRSFVHALSPRPIFRAALQFEDPCRLPECDDQAVRNSRR